VKAAGNINNLYEFSLYFYVCHLQMTLYIFNQYSSIYHSDIMVKVMKQTSK